MTRPLAIGFVPLADAALLLIAAAKGFDRAEGVEFRLTAEQSWAALRDKLALGIFDAAHILAPAAIALHAGLSGAPTPLTAASALGLDGNGVTVSPTLHAEMAAAGDLSNPAGAARALAGVVAARKASGARKLVLAHVYPYSMHHYQLREWLKLGGLGDSDVRLSVTPPPFMEEGLAAGRIDGFCVGAPWNAFAADSRAGVALFACRAMAPDSPEKIFAFRREAAQAEPETVAAATRALRAAACWAERPENADERAKIVAAVFDAGARLDSIRVALGADRLRIDPAALELRADHAREIAARMIDAGQAPDASALRAAADEIYAGVTAPALD